MDGSDGGRAAAGQTRRSGWWLLAAGALVVLLALPVVVLLRRPDAVPMDAAAGVVLYGLVAIDATMVVALVFVLARQVVKLVVEQRRGRPFARFHAKLVALLLSMTLVPAMLVLAVGSELIRTSLDRWFTAPIAQVLSEATQVAADAYHDRERAAAVRASRLAARLGREDGDAGTALARAVAADDDPGDQALAAYFVPDARGGLTRASVEVRPAATHPDDRQRRGEDDRAVAGGDEAAALAAAAWAAGATRTAAELDGRGHDRIRGAALVTDATGHARGVVVVTDPVAPEAAARARRLTAAFEAYSQLRVLRSPLTGVYLAFFVMVTLAILVGAIWMGGYLARRITGPIQRLEHAAREIGEGHLGQRVERQSDDEFGALTDAFNTMARHLEDREQAVARSTEALEARHAEVEGRRRYVEAVLERVTTGVVVVDARGTIATMNGAAAALLGVDASLVGAPVSTLVDQDALSPLRDLLRPGRERAPREGELVLTLPDREVHLAVIATPWRFGDHDAEGDGGTVLVLDDITPLVRSQQVAAWREVARRLAHEIKNPLTPIQLSAERLRRQFTGAPAGARDLVEECTGTIINEVESLKGLVDEFSQFARVPVPRPVPTDIHAVIESVLALYEGISPGITWVRTWDDHLPLVRVDPDQIRRVLINIIENAMEAVERHGTITIRTDPGGDADRIRVTVADDGPGIPPADREKLFLPYYSTKGRGSGLGLAIVRRILAEHGGTIAAGDHWPRGTEFTIELPT